LFIVSLVGNLKEGEVSAVVAGAGGVNELCLLIEKRRYILADNVTVKRVLYGIVRFSGSVCIVFWKCFEKKKNLN